MSLNYAIRLLAFVLIPFLSQAQSQVKGIVHIEDGTSLPYATVLLLNSTDSSMVRGQISGDDGSFVIPVSQEGQYFIAISAIGYHNAHSEIFKLNGTTNSYNIGTIILRENAELLGEVLVTAQKPMFEQRIDRTIINVQGLISRSGGSALDVLQRSPGVTVDKMNDAIALSGKQGVRIMINGKMSRLPMSAIVQMLSGMNAENIERIELITTPPSKFEAEGDAGVINIVMKKTEDQGTNGNVSLFTGHGKRNKYGGTLNMNSRSKRLNVFGDLASRNDYSRQHLNTRWAIPIEGDMHETKSNNNRKTFTGINSGALGFDWTVGKNTTLGGLFNFFDRKWDMDALANISSTVDQNPSNQLRMNTREKNDWLQLLGSLNLKHDFNPNYSISLDVDRINYSSANPTDYFLHGNDGSGDPTSAEQLRSVKDTNIKIWTSSVDFTGIVNPRFSFEAGAKVSTTRLGNDIVVESLINGSRTIDEGLTAFATMDENIAAGYASATIKALEHVTVQAGIRYEHTETNIDTRQQKGLINRNYGRWFPSVFINHKIDDNNSWVISYSRRITRPSFYQLAPFVLFNDPNNFFSGNIALLPSFTDAYKLEYRFKSILTSLQYSHDKNAITLFQPRVTSDNKQVSTAQNLDYLDNFSISVSIPFEFTKWWEVQLNATGGLSSMKARYTDNPVSLSMNTFNFNGSQKFRITKTVTAEVSGFYQSRRLFGILESAAFGGLDLGLEKKFQHSSLRVSYTDIIATNKWRWTGFIPSENINTSTYIDFETTVATITYALNFGNNKLKSRKTPLTGSREEQRRLSQ